MAPFFNLESLTEAQLCKVIATVCARNVGKKIGFVVDNEEAKIARYIQNIKMLNSLVVVERVGELSDGGFLLRATQPEHGAN